MKRRRSPLWCFAIYFLVFATVFGCGGGGGSSSGSGTTVVPTGNAAVTDQAVTSVQALGGGMNFPLLALHATAPSGLSFSKFVQKRAVKRDETYNASLNLYEDQSYSANTISINFYKDLAETQLAGSVTATIQGQTTSSTAYPKFPVTIVLSANVTGGNLPFTGKGQIVFADSSGKNTITGTINMPLNNTVATFNMTLSDSGQIGGTILVVQHGMTSTMTNLSGDLSSLTGDVTVAPQGWTGKATLSLINGTFSETLNDDGKSITNNINDAGNLVINYPDGTSTTITAPIGYKLGSTNVSTITNPTITISWPVRSKALSASASAFSVTVGVSDSTGGELLFNFDRNTAPAAYTQTYTLPGTFSVGNTGLLATFYSEAGEAGSVVATSSAVAAFSPNGLNLANIVFDEKIAKVAVTTSSLTVGAAASSLQFSATDSSGDVLAVTPGSAFWSLVSGSSNLTLTADGTATAVKVGSPTVKVSVDGVSSAATTIQILANKAAYQAPVAVPGPSGLQITRVLPTGQMIGNANGSAYYWSSPTAQPVALKGVGGSTLATAYGIAMVKGSVEIVGASVVAGSQDSYPAVWTSVTKAATELDSALGGISFGELPGSATSVNASGDIVGLIYSGEGSAYWTSPNATAQVLAGSQSQSANSSLDFDPYIADLGQVAYFVQFGTPGVDVLLSSSYNVVPHLLPAVTVYASGTPSDLGHYMSSAGVIGGSDTKSGLEVGAYWTSTDNYTVEHFLTSLPGGNGYQVLGVGENGWFVGNDSYRTQAVLWKTPTTPVDLSTLLPPNSGWTLTDATFVFADGSLIGDGYQGNGGVSGAVYIKAS